MGTTEHDTHRQRADLMVEAARRAADYIVANGDRPVFPTPEAVAGLARFTRSLPEEPTPPAEVLALLDRVGSPATVVSTRGRYFGYVNGGTDPVGAAAAVLVDAWDQNVALPVMSPVSAHLDEIASRWVCELLGLPESSTATFCSGASVANLTCVLAARDALLDRAGWNVVRSGLAGAPPLRVVASAEIHSSVAKALRAAGIGTDAIVPAPTDDAGRVRIDEFPTVDERTLVLLQAGNVNTGACDPFAELIPRVHQAGGWVHVDGAFGLWAAASPSRRHHVTGVEEADSWATDAHKWLNAPYDSGMAICRDGADLRRAMAFEAAYFATTADRPLAHLGLQMSQRARGVETWAILVSHGRTGIAGLVDRLCEHAHHMAELLARAGARILAAQTLNQVLVAFDDDDITDAVVEAVQVQGTCWVGPTTWHDQRAMRISICDASTTKTDITDTAAAIVHCWHAVTGRSIAVS